MLEKWKSRKTVLPLEQIVISWSQTTDKCKIIFFRTEELHELNDMDVYEMRELKILVWEICFSPYGSLRQGTFGLVKK